MAGETRKTMDEEEQVINSDDFMVGECHDRRSTAHYGSRTVAHCVTVFSLSTVVYSFKIYTKYMDKGFFMDKLMDK